MTSPNQGLPSHASWGVKRRDPGNEIDKREFLSRINPCVCAAFSYFLLDFNSSFARYPSTNSNSCFGYVNDSAPAVTDWKRKSRKCMKTYRGQSLDFDMWVNVIYAR